jgi:hypothetical protein
LSRFLELRKTEGFTDILYKVPRSGHVFATSMTTTGMCVYATTEAYIPNGASQKLLKDKVLV